MCRYVENAEEEKYALFETYDSNSLSSNDEGVAYYISDIEDEYIYSMEICGEPYEISVAHESSTGYTNASYLLDGTWQNIDLWFSPCINDNKTMIAGPQVLSYRGMGGTSFKLKSFEVYKAMKLEDILSE